MLFLGGLAALVVWTISRFIGPRQPAPERPIPMPYGVRTN
jgi:hypothetical protein